MSARTSLWRIKIFIVSSISDLTSECYWNSYNAAYGMLENGGTVFDFARRYESREIQDVGCEFQRVSFINSVLCSRIRLQNSVLLYVTRVFCHIWVDKAQDCNSKFATAAIVWVWIWICPWSLLFATFYDDELMNRLCPKHLRLQHTV
jgi:hypothetical protein